MKSRVINFMADLSTYISGLKLKNPIILASGILGETGKTLERVLKSGAAAVTTKSIGLKPRHGHKNPTIVELDHGLLNAMGLPNPGIDEYQKELKHISTQSLPVFGSIFGKNAEEFSALANTMEESGVAAVELNLSCPHASGYGSELGCDPKIVKDITKAVKDSVSIPIFVKLTPNTSDITLLGEAAYAGNCDALVAINTVKGMAISTELGRPVLSNRFGGYSGPGIKPIGLRCVYELAQKLPEMPIVGVGGILSATDMLEYLMAGATAVQIGIAVYREGVEVFNKINNDLEKFMDGHGYNSISDLIGIALK
jgi:dihydroorotate dehydrogenase (NAD+) catalytic subunit